jgi:4-hydroxy-tetrahydrodipicolinate synthase
MTELCGCGTAIVTPFADGAVDHAALRGLVSWQVQEGIDFLVACGSTGEAQTLAEHERFGVLETILAESARRVPVVMGATSNDTARAVEEARRAADEGADYILSAAPYYNKPGIEGMYRHFCAVADASRAPVILYNIPGRTGVNMPPALIRRLAAHPNIVGIKESSGDLQQIFEILRTRPDGFAVYAGDDWIALPVVLAGGDGCISVASNEVPRLMRKLVAFALLGDPLASRDLHFRLLPLMNANFLESNPAPVKAALARMRRIRNELRLPLVPASDATADTLAALLRELGTEIPA